MKNALPPTPARRGDRYLKAWDLSRKNPSVCVVLRAPSKDELRVWHVVGYERLVGEDFPGGGTTSQQAFLGRLECTPAG